MRRQEIAASLSSLLRSLAIALELGRGVESRLRRNALTVQGLAGGAMTVLGRQRLVAAQLVCDLAAVTATVQDALEVLLLGVDCVGCVLLPLALPLNAGIILTFVAHLSGDDGRWGFGYEAGKDVLLKERRRSSRRICAKGRIG